MINWSKKPSSHSLDLLIFGAHPDDAELMCSGTLTLLSKTKKVGVIDITEAELSTNGTPEQRVIETQNATKIMGLDARGNLKRKDGQLYRDHDLTEILTKVLRECQPKVIIGPPDNCRHPDHQALHENLNRAVFYCGLKKFCPEMPSISRPKYYQYLEVQNQTPDFCIDITSVWDEKVKAIQAYQSQFKNTNETSKTFINSGFLESLEQRFKQVGKDSGVEYAEPFLSSKLLCLKKPEEQLF